MASQETGLSCCLSAYKNVDKGKQWGAGHGAQAWLWRFFLRKPGDGIATTATHGPLEAVRHLGDGPPIKACPHAVKSPKRACQALIRVP